MMKLLFAPRFNRADFYGIVIFMAALANGASPFIAFPILIAWAGFSVSMERRHAK